MHVLMMTATLMLAATLGWLAWRMWRDVAPTVATILTDDRRAGAPMVECHRLPTRPPSEPVRSRRTNLPVAAAA